MPADPPPSLLITPDVRRRLQQTYDQAQRHSAPSRADIRRVHDLLAECVRADPGNILYVDALLANLRRRQAANQGGRWSKPWWNAWSTVFGRLKRKSESPAPERSDEPRTEHAVVATSHALLTRAPDLLWARGIDPTVLQKLAAAAGDCDFDEVELRYLTAAREVGPDDLETLRMLARALTRQGRFEQAVGPWYAVAALAAGDAEAQQAIDDLRGIDRHELPLVVDRHEDANIRDPQILAQQARSLQQAGDLAAAEAYFSRAQAASGGDLNLLQEREELRLRQSEERLVVARRRAQTDSHPKAQSLVSRLEDDHNRLAIEILHLRAERFPEAADVRIELARRLKRAGNFSGAIQRLEEAARVCPNEPAVPLELGECWQHLRQFETALDYYQQAVAKAEASVSSEPLQLARYRAALLAAAMQQPEVARQLLAAIVADDPAFKDARERLDRLGPN